MSDRDDTNKPHEGTEIGPAFNLHKEGYTLDKYRLIECIGEGTFGQVWKAQKDNVEVALKILKTSMTSEETQRELKSLEALRELRHKYLLQTNDFWSDGDQLFIEMELATGGSLKDRLKAWQSAGRKGIPPGELLKYFTEIAEVLDYLHGQRPRRFLHRDVKPANILLASGSAKLADFGLLRKVAGDHTGTKTQGGTPVFMAPESIKSDVFSPRTDLYSLAVTYAELRQGKLPFSGTTEYQVCNNILTSQPELGDELYPEEKQVLLKALDKDPEQRYASCGEFVAALKQAVPLELAANEEDAATQVLEASTPVLAGTTPRIGRRSATSMPRPAAETQAAPEPAPAVKPVSPKRSSWPFLLVAAAFILAGTGGAIWYLVNRDTVDPIHPVPVTRKFKIQTIPHNAIVVIDDKVQDQKTNGEFDVPIVPFQLRLRLPDYKEFGQEIGPDKKGIDVTLQKITAPPLLRKLQINTTPSEATVYIDDKPQTRKTNATFDVPVVPFKLRLDLAKHEIVEQVVAADQHEVNITLKELKAPPVVRKMEIKSTPPEATVFINKTEQAKKTNGFFEVPVGTFQLKLVMKDHKEVTQTIGPEQTNVAIALEKIPAIPTRAYALLIGVNQPTKQLPDFLHAEPDIVELGRVLLAGDYKPEHVQLLLQAQRENRPTAEQIRESLKALAKTCTSSDTLIVALAGHVVTLNGEPGGYFCSADCDLAHKATLVALADIFKVLEQCPAKSKLVLIDGWRVDLFAPPALPDGLEILRERVKEPPLPAGITLLASCSPGERGQEHPLLRHGLFYHAVIRGLQGSASVTPDRHITVDGLTNYVIRQVADTAKHEYKQKQVPELVGADVSKAAIRFTQSDVLSRVHEGLLAIDEKKYDQALTAFTDAAAKNPAYVDLFLGRALAHYHKGKDEPSHYDDAIRDCEHALKLDPRNAHAYSYLAQIAAVKARKLAKGPEQDKEFARALENHERDIQFDPQWAMPYNTRGVTHALRGAYPLAIKDYTESIRLNPRLKFPYENRGFAWTTQKEYESAIKDFDKAIDINPGNALTWARRGGAYRNLRQFDRALEDLTKAVNLDPKNANFLYSRGQVHFLNKDFNKAIVDFTETLEITKDRETYYSRGYAYNEKGVKDGDIEMYNRAIRDLNEALELSPNYVPALYVRGVAYQNKAKKAKDEKLFDLAIADFSKALELQPKHANALYGRGLAYRAKGQKALGDADVKKARAIDPNVGQTPDSPQSRLAPIRPLATIAYHFVSGFHTANRIDHG
jgi:serine/threonine protein kinase/tetratricopeptide (TPR) repeat protein